VWEELTRKLGLEKSKEPIDAHARVLEDVGERRSLDGSMGRHGELQGLLGEVLLQSDVTPRWRTTTQPSRRSAKMIFL